MCVPYTCHSLNNPPSSHIYRLFRATIFSPKKEPPLTSLRNFSEHHCTIQRLIIAYNRPKNIGNYTSPRKLRSTITPVSTHLLTTQTDSEPLALPSTRSVLLSSTVNTTQIPGALSRPKMSVQPPAHTRTNKTTLQQIHANWWSPFRRKVKLVSLLFGNLSSHLIVDG